MKQEYKLVYGVYGFLFTTEQDDAYKGTPKMEGYGNGYPYIGCTLCRTDNIHFNWTWQGILLPGKKVEFRLVYDNGVNIKGYITLFQSAETGEDFIFMDTYYGLGYEEHFEGNILELNEERPPKPPVPPPVPPFPPDPGPGPDPGPFIPDEWAAPAGFRDLFPYLYLQYWPELQYADKLYTVEYPADMAAASPFYRQLQASLSVAEPRPSMENEALDFINGTGSYTDRFLPAVAVLPFPLNIYPELYDIIYERRLLADDDVLLCLAKNPETYFTGPYMDCVAQVWENFMALNIVEGYRPDLQDQWAKLLTVNHVFSCMAASPPAQLDAAWVQQLIRAFVVLPAPVFPLPPYTYAPFTGGPAGCAVPYAVGDLQMVRHKPLGYETGEIARIENILAGEMKKTRQRKTETVRQTRHTDETVYTGQTGLNREDALEKQVMRTIADSLSETYDFGDLKQSYGPPTTGTYSGKVTKDTLRNESRQGPDSFAKMILSQTVSKLRKEVSEQREHSLRTEAEESVSHVVDNRAGLKNIQGIYCWLNRVYEMQLVNYGHRFLLEFLVPKPVDTADWADGNFCLPPVPPARLPEKIVSYLDITPENYLRIGALYDIHTLPPPPADTEVTGAQVGGNSFPAAYTLAVPDGYLPDTLTVSYKTDIPGTLVAGIRQADLPTSLTQVQITDPLGLEDSPPSEVSPVNLGVPLLVEITPPEASPPSVVTFFVNAVLYCCVSTQAVNAWKQAVFARILEGYEEQKERFRRQMHRLGQTNPDLVDQAARGLVKSACKRVLWKVHAEADGSPLGLSPPEDTVNKPAYAHFYEEAFEWDKMAYSLEGHALDSVRDHFIRQPDTAGNGDRLEKLMAAEAIRVLLPVSGAYHHKILYYLSAGIMAYGADHLTPVFETDTRTAVKLKKVFAPPSGPVDTEPKKWIIRVPTEMQWLTDAGHVPFIRHTMPL